MNSLNSPQWPSPFPLQEESLALLLKGQNTCICSLHHLDFRPGKADLPVNLVTVATHLLIRKVSENKCKLFWKQKAHQFRMPHRT